jgi:hypothetical protein
LIEGLDGWGSGGYLHLAVTSKASNGKGHVLITVLRHNFGREIKNTTAHTRVYPKVSGLAVWSENSKWYSSLPLDAIVSLFCESV